MTGLILPVEIMESLKNDYPDIESVQDKLILKVNYKTANVIFFKYVTNIDDCRKDATMGSFVNKYLCFTNDLRANSAFKAKLLDSNDYVIVQVKKKDQNSYIVDLVDETDGLYLKYCSFCGKYLNFKDLSEIGLEQCILSCNYGPHNKNKYKLTDISSLYGRELEY